MQLPPLVAVMRTVVAVTAPLLAAGPIAVTQSPTARSVDAAVCVLLTGVELEAVTLTVSVLGAVGFVVLELLLLFELLVLWKLPGARSNPDTVSVVPLTAVTLPDAMENEPRNRLKLPGTAPFGNEGRVPLPPSPLLRKKPPPPVPARKPPPGAAPFARVRPEVHEPLALGVVTVMVRAAMVVFDDFDAVPVAVTQSPTAMELTDSVTVFEKSVEAV
ncbi:MAG TPA: hypothetical protein VIX84_05160, partial [Acidimicrobiales bacterium]